MWSSRLYFITLSLVALTLIAPMAHLLELSRKIGMSGDEYLIVQKIYFGWAWLGSVIFLALVSTLTLAIVIRDDHLASLLAAGAFIGVACTQLVFWVYTFPVNRATRNWTILPDAWMALRRQWEYSHAASAILSLIAFLLLAASVVVRLGRGLPK